MTSKILFVRASVLFLLLVILSVPATAAFAVENLFFDSCISDNADYYKECDYYDDYYYDDYYYDDYYYDDGYYGGYNLNIGHFILLGVVLGGLAGGVMFAWILHKYKTNGVSEPYPYEQKAPLSITNAEDVFVDRVVTSVRIESNNHHHHPPHR